MTTNGLLKNKNGFHINQKIQKAILAGIGATTSQGVIRKAAVGIYDDVQKIVRDLLVKLEQQGKLKTIEAKKIIKELQKKSDSEKIRIYKKLEKEGKTLFDTAKDIVLTPLAVASQVAKTVKSSKNTKSRSWSSKRSRSTRRRKSRLR